MSGDDESPIQFEYRIEHMIRAAVTSFDERLDWLNRLGAEGWVLTTIKDDACYFARPLLTEDDDEKVASRDPSSLRPM